jgi:hypothetical protein
MLKTLEGEIILADVFHDVPIGPYLETHQSGPRFDVALGIVKGEVNLQSFIVHAMDALDNVHLLAFRVTHTIQPIFPI